MLSSHSVTCPYCGQENEVTVDPSAGARQSYVEDCQVCCRPWQVRVRVRRGEPEVTLYAEDESGMED